MGERVGSWFVLGPYVLVRCLVPFALPEKKTVKSYDSGQIIIFHQPLTDLEIRGIPETSATFLGPKNPCGVAIIWPCFGHFGRFIP